VTRVLERNVLSDAVTRWLADNLDRPVGRGQAPPGQDGERPFPYAILYTIPGGSFSGGPLVEPDADASVVYQINCAALRVNQAEQLADAARAVMLERTSTGFTIPSPEVPGWVIIDRAPDGAPGGTEYSGTPPKRVFTAAERYVLHVTPA
jgi:hypothetical protein